MQSHSKFSCHLTNRTGLRALSLAALLAALQACGGGGAEPDTANATPPRPPSSRSVSLAWTPPTQRADGTALGNLAGYKIHYGASPSDLSLTITLDNAGLARYVVDDLDDGTYYFAVSAFDSDGLESTHSNTVSRTIG